MVRELGPDVLLGEALSADGTDELAPLCATFDTEHLDHPRHLGVGHTPDHEHARPVNEPVLDC